VTGLVRQTRYRGPYQLPLLEKRSKTMPMRIGTEMPSLAGATEWFGGTQALAENESRGRVTLVHFWSVSCGVCKENLPRVAQWRDDHRDQDFRVVAVHMPRYETDTDMDSVREAIANFEISEPCAIDNEHKLREVFQNDQGYVPAYYLFDGEGKLRSFAAGERGLDLLKSSLERLLKRGKHVTTSAAE
jgi:thiol-disulfide isomerase/thioredoxin